MTSRRAAHAGTFYELGERALQKQIEDCFQHSLGPGFVPQRSNGNRLVISLIVPHAGYMYSGPVAAHAYAKLRLDGVPSKIVILGPNHYGLGSGVSIMTEGIWETPLGNVAVDTELAQDILQSTSIVDVDELGHKYEHSIEVQLPFLMHSLRDELRFVPISMMMQDLQTCLDVGEALYDALKDSNAIVIGSTDWTHYEPHDSAKAKDAKLISETTALNPSKFHDSVERNNVSMCGPGPTTVCLHASKLLGAREVSLLKYATSGDITGDTSSVVGYASIAITR